MSVCVYYLEKNNENEEIILFLPVVPSLLHVTMLNRFTWVIVSRINGTKSFVLAIQKFVRDCPECVRSFLKTCETEGFGDPVGPSGSKAKLMKWGQEFTTTLMSRMSSKDDEPRCEKCPAVFAYPERLPWLTEPNTSWAAWLQYLFGIGKGHVPSGMPVSRSVWCWLQRPLYCVSWMQAINITIRYDSICYSPIVLSESDKTFSCIR